MFPGSWGALALGLLSGPLQLAKTPLLLGTVVSFPQMPFSISAGSRGWSATKGRQAPAVSLPTCRAQAQGFCLHAASPWPLLVCSLGGWKCLKKALAQTAGQLGLESLPAPTPWK